MFPTFAWIFLLLDSPVGDEEKNITLWQRPADLVVTSAVVAGTLPADRTQFGDARRVWALPGPGATLRGLATLLQDQLLKPARLPQWSTLQGRELVRLGSALYRVGRRIETGTAEALSAQAAADWWMVGTLFPLPIWQPAGGQLQVDVGAVQSALGAVPQLGFGTVGEWIPATTAARGLDQVDPFQVKTPIVGAAHIQHAVSERERLHNAASAASTDELAGRLGGAWGTKARWNPYAALFPIVETVAHYRANAPARLGPFTTGFHGAFTAAEREAFASTSAGYALIRCLWRASAAGRTADLAQSLGAAPANTLLLDPYPISTGRTEPPIARGREAVIPPPAGVDGAWPLMGFGRRVPFVIGGYQGRFRGIRWEGTVPPASVLIPGGPVTTDFTYPSPAHAAQWSRVLAAIATTEGNLDAATSWDRAVVSLGFQQWSMHVRDSGPALLARVKRLHPEVFDAVAHAAEIDAGIGDTPAAARGTEIGEIVAESNLWTLTPLGAIHLNGPGYTSNTVQGGLGWTRPAKTWVIGEPSARFSARWAVAARFVPAIWQAQAEMAGRGVLRLHASLGGGSTTGYSAVWRDWGATIRLAQIADVPGIQDGAASRAATVFDLFASEAAVASVLDHSVNLPGDVARDIRRAIDHAAKAQQRERPITVVDSEFLLRVLVAHQGTRQLNAAGGVVDVARERVAKLVRLYDAANGMSLTKPFLWP